MFADLSDSDIRSLDSDRTLKRFLTARDVSSGNIQDTIRLAVVPNRLRTFENTKILPVATDRLRNYCAHNKAL